VHSGQKGMETQVERLGKRLSVFRIERVADAAVALLLRVCHGHLEILLVKKVDSVTDAWSGQTSLPGGKHEGTDRDLRDTVVRETLEETGIDLRGGCRFLGVMAVHDSAMKPRTQVLPFVVLLEKEPSIRLSRGELESYAWIPLDQFATHRQVVRFVFGEFPAFVFGRTVIWGLTYRILEHFLRMLE
jgi:8-oxo-dGTP pyrophosphatase MutT (NUDIX family)